MSDVRARNSFHAALLTHHVQLISFFKVDFVFAREYFFAESFTRVTGLIVQLRRGKANFFLTGFMEKHFQGASRMVQSSPVFSRRYE